MFFLADLHIHSKYSRATSPSMNLESLSNWAKIKGIKVLGTGDFTHPGWFKELKENLKVTEPGLYSFKKSQTRFLLSAEISCIYSKNNKVRKIHIIIFAPSLKVVEKINKKLDSIGNIKSDGRPILGLDAKELLKIVLDICPDCLIIPAHIWTPWFSLFGSKSGFDSIQECFDDYSKYIFALETGLSSDPKMNWQISMLDNITLISNSDCHSPSKIGREANAFNTNLDYYSIIKAIKEKDSKKFLYTIEFFPEEGKYHYDGHRLCNISFNPKESKRYNNICPKCKKPLTIGVLNRVEELKDRRENQKPKKIIPFKSLIPLVEIISQVLKVGPLSLKVRKEYEKLTNAFENEFDILLNVPEKKLKKIVSGEIVQGIIKTRKGEVNLVPGYDGVYGKINFVENNS